MTDFSTPFPPLPEAKLTRDDVIAYLLNLMSQGHDIYQDPKNDDVFVLILDELHQIKFSVNTSNSECQVQGMQYDFPQLGLCDVNSMVQLQEAVASMARKVVGSWPSRPTRGRLSAGMEATNYQTISNLIGTCSVEAVFDPYLENRSLTMLQNILSFGGTVATGVRLLGSTRKAGGQNPTFTKAGVDAWFSQRGIAGEARVMAPNDQHRRFLLLSGGQSLILGPSLNSIHKNEAVNIDRDTEDRAFFDGVWDTSTPLT